MDPFWLCFLATKCTDPSCVTVACRSNVESSEPERHETAGDAKLNFVMGADRVAVGFNDTDVVSDKVASRVKDLANRMDEALHFKQPTRNRHAPSARKPLKKDEGDSPQAVPKGKGWRERVAQAKQHAAATISIMNLLKFDLVKQRNYYDTMPPAIEETLGDDFKSFLKEYTKVTEVLAEVREADKISIESCGEDNGKDSASGLTEREESQVLNTRSSAEARNVAKEVLSRRVKAEHDIRDGVDRQDERIRGSLMLMETYLSRTNEVEGMVRQDQEGTAKMPSSDQLPQPLQKPLPHFADVWQKNPATKAESLQMTSQAKSDAKYGKIAMLIYAADLGPEMRGNQRQPLWAMEPFDMLAEIHQEQVYKSCVEKAAKVKMERDEAVARGEIDESTEAELPVQAPNVSKPVTTHVEGMSIGSRMMTQLVADVTEHCGTKALNSLIVILVVSNATESIIIKDMRANDFYGLNQANVLFINQPDLPGFRYVPEINLFRADGSSKSARYGTGYAIEQLTYPGEAFLISADERATKRHLVESALDHLSSAGVEWLFKTRIRLMCKEVFDIQFMAHSIALQQRFGANMTIDVVKTTMHTAREWGNVTASRPTADATTRDVAAPYFTRVIGNEAISTTEAQKAVMEMYESQTDDEQKALYSFTGRYLISLVALQGAMDTIRFSPSFCLEYELEDEERLLRLKSVPAIYPQVYAHDLTHVESIKPFSISLPAEQATKDIGQIQIGDPVDMIRHISNVQDVSPRFQSLVKKQAMKAKAKGIAAPNLVMNNSGNFRHTVVVAIAENQACRVILELVNELVIPGVDEIHLVHVCKNSDGAARAQKVLSQFDVESPVQLTRHVVVMNSGLSVAEMLLEKTEHLKGSLLVLASEKLDRSHDEKMGSTAVALCRKRLPCSLLVVKSFSTAAKNATRGLSYVVGVDASALEMFEWLCGTARRGKDNMYSANCSGSTSTSGMVRKTDVAANVINIFKDKAVAFGFRPLGKLLDGKPSVELPKLANNVQADIVVVSASKKSGEVSKGATAILKDPLAPAVLIYRPTQETKRTSL